jgi:hypothetical protein
MYDIGPIAFASPGILLALLLLPALWWLLRITPPTPRIVRFPPVRLLFGLHSEEETPASAPLWLILLRLTIAALLILGLAHPLFNPGGPLGGNGAVMLVIDDGWASAAGWDRRQKSLSVLIDRAERSSRPIVILSTAPSEAGQSPEPSGLMGAADAKSIAGALQPKPWPVDRLAAAQSLAGMEDREIGLIVGCMSWPTRPLSCHRFCCRRKPAPLRSKRLRGGSPPRRLKLRSFAHLRWMAAFLRVRSCNLRPALIARKRPSICRWNCATRSCG